MDEFQRLLDDFMGNPSGEQECLNLVDYFRTLPRYRMDDRALDDIQGKLWLLQPRDTAEAEHFSAVNRAVTEYRGRNHSRVGSITRVLNTVIRDFTGVYSEEDFEAQLAKIREASEQGGANAERLVQVNRLYEMIGAYNADPLFPKKIGAAADDIWLLNLDLYRRVEFPAGSPQEGYYRVEGAGLRTPREWRAFDSFYERIIRAAGVPDAEEMKTLLLRYILQEYQNYPTPSRRILQIVDYMTGKTALFREDHWEADSLRLRILKQFVKYGNCMMYHPEDSPGPVYIVAGRPAILEYIQKRYEEEGRQVAQKDITNQMILDKIDEHVFDVLEEEEIRRIVPLAAERIQSEGGELTYETIDQYAGQCGCGDIREEVIRYYLRRMRKKFPGIAYFPEDGFRYIHEIYKDNVKPKGTWEILRAADDLAAGRFGENTKRYLYLFALVFGMTYRNPDSSDSEFTDVDVNLFQKLYVDEPQRTLISDEQEEQDGRKRNRKDLPPSGQGINRKDFREMICLYFIRKPFRTQEDLVRKVADCDKMIRSVEKPVIVPGIHRGEPTHTGTEEKRAVRDPGSTAWGIWEMSEPEFENYLRRNYDCRTSGGKLTGMQARQDCAYREYQFYMTVLYGLMVEGGIDALDLSNLREKPDLLDRRFQDIAGFNAGKKWMGQQMGKLEIGKGLGWFERWTDDLMEDSVDRQTVDGPEDEDAFGIFEDQIAPEDLHQARRVIDRADKMIGSCFPLIRKPEKMSRNALLGAYYYCYTIWNVMARDNTETEYPENPVGFMGVYEDFGKGSGTDKGWRHVWKGADAVLEAAGYQALSTKNLLDVLVVFSIYEKYAML